MKGFVRRSHFSFSALWQVHNHGTTACDLRHDIVDHDIFAFNMTLSGETLVCFASAQFAPSEHESYLCRFRVDSTYIWIVRGTPCVLRHATFDTFDMFCSASQFCEFLYTFLQHLMRFSLLSSSFRHHFSSLHFPCGPSRPLTRSTFSVLMPVTSLISVRRSLHIWLMPS